MELGLALFPSTEKDRLLRRSEAKWSVRRTLGLLLFVSGVFWLALGAVLHFLFF
jgi:hypothetical protein